MKTTTNPIIRFHHTSRMSDFSIFTAAYASFTFSLIDYFPQIQEVVRFIPLLDGIVLSYDKIQHSEEHLLYERYGGSEWLDQAKDYTITNDQQPINS